LNRVERLREYAAAASAAVFGFAVGVALLPAWLRPARPGQLPSFMTSAGLDARAGYNFFIALVLLTLLAPLAARPLIRRLAAGERWALNAAAFALASALWIAIAQETPAWVIVPPLAAVLLCERLRFRRMAFTRRDAVLVPMALCVFMAVTDVAPAAAFGRRVVVSAALVLLVRLLLPLVRRRGLDAATCCAFAPLALVLQSHYVGYRQRHLGWPALLFALLVPFVMRLFVKRRLQRTLAYVVYPIVILAYASASSTFAAEGKPHADLFEDAHNLTVASEMLRGERPYRDINPTHGLIQDGVLDFLILRTGRETAGRANATHGVIGSIVSLGTYAAAACATGSPHIGLLGYFLAAVMNIAGGGVRAAPALFALALLAGALRRRRPRLFAYAAVVLVVAGLTALDFAVYAAAAFAVALWRMPPGVLRRAALRASLVGLASAGGVTLVAFLIGGVLVPFLRTTFVELPPLASLYALTPFAPTDALRAHRFPPEVLAAFFDPASFLFIVYVVVLAGVAVLLQTPRDRRRDALLVLGVWMVAAGLSYAERQHLYFQYTAAPLAAAAATLLWIRRHRAAAALLIVALLVLARPTEYLIGVDIRRHAHGPFDPDLVTIDEIPRARGALYRSKDAAVIRAASKYTSTALRPGETFFDFTNRGALYFLLERDCPIRQVEVAFYEPPELQREVVARLAANTRITAALIPKPDDPTAVDGVPSRERAPLVWQYLQQHFRPDFEEGDVVFWRRVW